jgi:hypothetical protein
LCVEDVLTLVEDYEAWQSDRSARSREWGLQEVASLASGTVSQKIFPRNERRTNEI